MLGRGSQLFVTFLGRSRVHSFINTIITAATAEPGSFSPCESIRLSVKPCDTRSRDFTFITKVQSLFLRLRSALLCHVLFNVYFYLV